MLKRKIYDELVAWKNNSKGETALMIDGARRVGKSFIVEEFAKAEYRSYIIVDFGQASQDVLDLFINDTLELLGDLTTPLSMLIIGSMLCESPSKECFFYKKLYLIVFIRLLFIPACIYFILKGIVNDKLLLSIPVILTSMPIATNAAIIANKYKANESLASQLVFLSALLSIITIPFISFLFIR